MKKYNIPIDLSKGIGVFIWLNLITSKIFLYTSNLGKVILVVIVVYIIMLWSFIRVKICNKYIPKWTGFKNLL